MINSEDLQLVSLLARENSIAGAARKLNLTASAVSQRLSALEDRTGLILADRNGRSGIVLTADGAFIADRASRVLSEFSVLEDQINHRRGVISGNVHVVAPFGFGRHRIAPCLGELSALYPELSIDLQLSDDLNAIPHSTWDILIRVAPLHDSSLVSTVLSENRRLVCASPSYVQKKGLPSSPEDLKNHRCISISEDGTEGAFWAFRSDANEEVSVKIDPHLKTNDGETALEWTISGLGIVMRSEWSAARAIEAGELVEITPAGWSADEAPIVALTTERHSQSIRVSTVLDYLKTNVSLNAGGD